MRLVEIQLDGFGRLVNRTFQFARGFNLIFGPNEAGKSTLQQAMLALLYGFFAEGRITAASRSIVETFQPWDENAAYSGSLVYTLDDGQTFRVTRTLGLKQATSLATYPDETDVSTQFKRASQGRLFFADAQLGMGKEVFESTCYVRQAELVALESSANAITETLMRLSASASPDTTAADAIANLEKKVKDEVGTPRARTKPLPQAIRRLSGLEQERSQVSQARRELFSQIVELNQSEERLQNLELERGRLQFLQSLAESQAIRQRLSAADRAAAEVSYTAEEVTRWKAWATFEVHLRDDVLGLNTQRHHLQRECEEAEQQATIARDKLQPIKTRIAAVEECIKALEDVRDVPLEELPQVRDLASQWKMASETRRSASERWHKASAALREAEQQLDQAPVQLDPLFKLGHAGLAALQQELRAGRQRVNRATESLNHTQSEWARVGMGEAQFQEMEHAAQDIQSGARPVPEPRKGCLSFLSSQSTESADQTPTEMVIYAQLKPIYQSLVRARAEAESAQEALVQMEADITSQLGALIDNTLDDHAFAQLGQRLEHCLQAVAEAKRHKATVADLQSELDAAQQDYAQAAAALQTRLADMGFDTTDLQIAFDTYVKQCERKEQLERAEAELERLRLRAEALERDIRNWLQKQAALERTETELCALLAQAGIGCSGETLEAGLVRFSEGVDNYERWARAKAAHEAAVKHHSSLMNAETRADLETSLAELELTLAGMRAGHPEWSKFEPEKPSQEYAALSRQTDEAWGAARRECDRLRESIQLTTSNLRHPADIDEEIGVARANIVRLEWFRDALGLAREELAQATPEFQKQFAPKLEVLVSEGLSKVTDARYSDVLVDPTNLSVSLTVPELDRPVGVEQLSTGTRDLVYLMLRVAIARLMSRTEEKLPLLLDDPLVQCDRARQKHAMEFLAQLAEKTQVFLFTKDDWIRAWFDENLGSHSLHGIHLLP